MKAPGSTPTLFFAAVILLLCSYGCATTAPATTSHKPHTSIDADNAVVIVPNQNRDTEDQWQAGMSGISSALNSTGIPFNDMETAIQAYRNRSGRAAAVPCNGTALSCGILQAASAGYSHAIAFVVLHEVQGAILVFNAGYCVSISTFTAEKPFKKDFEKKARIEMTKILNSNIFQNMPDQRGIAPLHK